MKKTMKKLLILLLLLPVFAAAQDYRHKRALYNFYKDSSGTLLELPEIRSWDLYHFFEIGGRSTYTYTVHTDSLYYAIFKKTNPDSLPSINFMKQELVARIACAQCLTYCRRNGWENQPCHRNACRYSVNWYLRKKNSKPVN
jgi:hypothetical protein